MKAAIIPLLCVLASSTCIVIFSQTAVSQTQQEAASDKRLNSLLTERRDTLRQVVDLVIVEYRGGAGTIEEIIQAQNALLDAELDIAKTNAERVRIREEQVKNFRELENLLKQRHESGSGITKSELLVAKATRLEAEINLLRE